MALLHIKLDGEIYKIEKLTLGEGQVLKRDYGMLDLSRINLADPDQLVGLLSIHMKRTHPELSEEEIQATVKDLDFLTIESLEEDPQPAVAPVADGNGSPGMTPEISGIPQSLNA